MRDFRSFAAADAADDPEKADRSGLVLEISSDGALVLFGIEGSHFPWKMVRRIVGVLVEVGRGAMDPSAIERFLSERSTAPARLTAPPSGLFLDRVYCKSDPRDGQSCNQITK